MARRLQRKKKMQLIKARLAAAKGTSAAAATTANAVVDESFATAGPQRAAPLIKRQRSNAAPGKFKRKDHILVYLSLNTPCVNSRLKR